MSSLQVNDAYSYGSRAADTIDDAQAWNKAFAASVVNGLPVYIRPGVYRAATPINWTGAKRVDVIADNVVLEWHGPVYQVVLSYGGIPGVTIRGARLRGLTIRNPGNINGCTGVRLQNMHNADIDLEDVSGFDNGVELRAYASYFAYNILRMNVSNCFTSLYARTQPNSPASWMNGLTFNHCRFGPRNGAASTFVEAVFAGQAFDNWVFNRCFFEASGDGGLVTLLKASKCWAWRFTDCHFEAGTGKFKWDLGDDVHVYIDGGERPALDTTGWVQMAASYIHDPSGGWSRTIRV